MFKVCVYFGAVTGGQNGISGPAGVAANYVFRTHSITFTRNDVYMTSIHTYQLFARRIYTEFNRFDVLHDVLSIAYIDKLISCKSMMIFTSL